MIYSFVSVVMRGSFCSSPGNIAVSSFPLLCIILDTCTTISLAQFLVYRAVCLGTLSRVYA